MNETRQIAIVLPPGRQERRRACRAMAQLMRHRIVRLPNSSFEVSIAFAGDSEVRLSGQTRAYVLGALDDFFRKLAGPEFALGLHRELARLRERREANGLLTAGPMITPDGRVENIDAMGTA